LQETNVREAKDVELKKLELTNALTHSPQIIEVSAECSGVIKSLAVMEGSRIQVGQELGKVKDDRALIALQKATYEWEVACKKQSSDIAIRLTEKAALVAVTEYERAVRANKEIPNTYAENEIDRRKLVYEKAQLEIEQAAYNRSLAEAEVAIAKTGLEQAELELRQHRIQSPVNGMVVAVKRRAGEWVEPGVTVVEIVDMDVFRVEGFLTVVEAAALSLQREAHVVIPVGDQALEKTGKVVFVSPEANPLNLQVRVILEFPFNSEKERDIFRSGLKCRAWIDVEAHTQFSLRNATP
jgi:multidrug efflux pump subunit AcrA (membrane-fusion protein)